MNEVGVAGERGPWSYIQDWDVESIPVDLRNEQERDAWVRALFVAGGLPYMWRELARPMQEIVRRLLDIGQGDRVLVIGEGIEPSGWTDLLREEVGESGVVDATEIIRDGRAAVKEGRVGRNGKTGCWSWNYAADAPDNHYDAVAILQAAQHCDDWKEAGQRLTRVLRPGGVFLSVEMCIEGPTFRANVNSDLHLRQWHDKLFPRGRGHISNYSAEELRDAMSDYLPTAHALEWKGIELFWGIKPTS